MSYSDKEISVQDGEPFLLYEFKRGSQVWRYTNAVTPVVSEAQTFEPTPIRSDGFNQSGDMTRDNLNVSFPRGHEFAAAFLKQVVYEVVSLTVYRSHFGVADRLVFWKGRVVTAKAKQETITLECEPIFTALRRYGLRARFQKTCRHPLYGRGCNLNPASFVIPGLVADATTPTTFRFYGATLTKDQLIGGMIKLPDGTFRHIVNQAMPSQILTLGIPAFELQAQVIANGNAPVLVYPGCDHTSATCVKKFNNLNNFGGFPWIPSRNPFDGSIS